MTDRNRKVLFDLQQRAGNNVCADCRSNELIDWASCNLGVFLCQECAGVHRSLGVEHSRVKSIKYDNWEDDQVQKMAECGNNMVNQKYEQFLPPYYRRPSSKNDAGIVADTLNYGTPSANRVDPDETAPTGAVSSGSTLFANRSNHVAMRVLRSQFIHAKYQRKEFVYQDKQTPYSSNKKEGILMKRGKRKERFAPRKFVLNSKDNYLQYYKPNAKEPKDTLPLDDVNVVFAPDKVGNPNGFQITYLKNGSTRNIFLYCDDSKEAVDWFTAIRSAKLERRKLAFPDRDEAELCKDLTQDFICEGYLHKRGPRNEPYRKRWFTLDRRKLMYLEAPLAPFPKGEVYIGHKDASYSVGNGENSRCETLEFILEVTGRTFNLKADSLEDKEKWIQALRNIINTPPTPQDLRLFSNMHHR